MGAIFCSITKASGLGSVVVIVVVSVSSNKPIRYHNNQHHKGAIPTIFCICLFFTQVVSLALGSHSILASSTGACAGW